MYALDVVFRKTDFFKLLDVGKEVTPSMDLGPAPYFSELMDQAAFKRGCAAWVEKTPAHTYFISEIITWYPDAKLVAVERGLIDQLKSFYIGLERKKNLFRLFRAAVVCEVYKRILRSFSEYIYIIQYESLLEDYDATVQGVFEYLGVKVSGIPKSPFQRNSSFAKEGRAFEFNLVQRCAITFAALVVKLMPMFLIKSLVSLKKKFGRKSLPRWAFYSNIHNGEL